jgi:hypothetical protein
MYRIRPGDLSDSILFSLLKLHLSTIFVLTLSYISPIYNPSGAKTAICRNAIGQTKAVAIICKYLVVLCDCSIPIKNVAVTSTPSAYTIPTMSAGVSVIVILIIESPSYYKQRPLPI